MAKGQDIKDLGKRVCARLFKEKLMGHRNEKLDYPEISEALEELDEKTVFSLNKSNWHYYWRGDFFPTKDTKKLISENFGGLIDWWQPTSKRFCSKLG